MSNSISIAKNAKDAIVQIAKNFVLNSLKTPKAHRHLELYHQQLTTNLIQPLLIASRFNYSPTNLCVNHGELKEDGTKSITI